MRCTIEYNDKRYQANAWSEDGGKKLVVDIPEIYTEIELWNPEILFRNRSIVITGYVKDPEGKTYYRSQTVYVVEDAKEDEKETSKKN